MGQLILARCGATDFDEQDRIVGNLDIPVNVRGQAEMAELANDLAGRSIHTIYSSAGESARESARFLAERLGVKVRVLEELRNIDFGLWQGLPVAEVRRKHPKVFKQWEQSPCAICPPAGEMLDVVIDRVRRALKPVLRRCQNSTCVLVAPDPLRQVIRCYLKNTDVAHLLEDHNGSIWETIEVA